MAERECIGQREIIYVDIAEVDAVLVADVILVEMAHLGRTSPNITQLANSN